MNYALLRQEGMRHLERLGSAIWTDFNSHDPGVTILEVLCYALTDLGYRTQLSEADLFAPSGTRKAFFTVAEILPNAPVTALDFRKILIDTEGVKNAWLEGCHKETVLYQLAEMGRKIDLKLEGNKYPTDPPLPNKSLQFSLDSFVFALQDPTSIAPNTITKFSEYLNAIYRLKKAKKGKAIKALEKSFLEALRKQVEDKLEENGKKIILLDNAHKNATDVLQWIKKSGLTETRQTFIEDFKNIPELLKKGDKAATNFALNRLYKITIDDVDLAFYFFVKPIWHELICQSNIIVKTSSVPSTYSLFNPKGIYTIYLQLEEAYAFQADKVRAAALKRLHENRALSEDFDPNIKIVENVPIGISTDIDITPEADVVQVFAEILYAIESFLSPVVQMYSLEEMMYKYAAFELTNTSFENLVEDDLPAETLGSLEILRGVSFIGKLAWEKAVRKAIGTTAWEDYEGLIFKHTQKIYETHQVFQGPLLNHGFIDDGELEAAHWRRVVYKSDMFQIMSKVANVVRVQKLDIKKCLTEEENKAITEKEKWCLSFDCDCQPMLDIDSKCSSFNFTKEGRPIFINESMHYEVLMRLEQLRGQTAKIDRSSSLDLPMPKGIMREDLAEYTSIQEEFPKTYHVGRENIISTETPLRKAQVKQMKGFLMFFDQILANYLARLAQVRDILLVDNKGQNPPALYQPLYDVPFVQNLFTAFDYNGGDWETFKNDDKNAYIKALSGLTEGSAVTQKMRQNKILDHLLARFGEQFTDYVLELFKIERPLTNDVADTTEGLEDWIGDKQRMLKNMPILGSLRGRGFNYQVEPDDDFKHFWESDNVEGFKRRVMAQLGIEDWTRKTISCTPKFFIDTKLETINRTKRYRFGIKSDENSSSFWLLSTDAYNQKNAAEQAGDAFFSLAADVKKYGLVQSADKKFYFVGFWSQTSAQKEDNAMLLSLPMKENEAKELLREITRHIEQHCQSQSFHVVEHILLRPTDEHYTPLLKPMVCSSDLSRLDPYSFCITLILPDWVELFSNEKQYYHFEQLVRSELPAHVMPCFKKLSREQLLQFEETYFNWLKVKTDKDAEAFDLREATNNLVELMNNY
jgi:hypothetical protein